MDLKAHTILEPRSKQLVLEGEHESPGKAKDEKIASGPNNPQSMRSKAEDEESDEDSCSDDGLCRCPVWWGQAPEAGPLCSDCFKSARLDPTECHLKCLNNVGVNWLM